MPSTTTRDISAEQVNEAVSGLMAAAKQAVSSKQDPLQLQAELYVDTVCEYAYRNGLSALTLRQLLDTVTLSSTFHLRRPNSLKIIKSLYPAGKVSSDLVCLVISSLGPGKSKPAASVQSSLLKWILMVYPVLDDPSILSHVYSVIFNMLDMLSLRANLCQLLAMITKRKHVKPFRIQYLKELSNTNREPALTALIRVFENYCSDAPFGETVKGRASAFTHPDAAFGERLQIIQLANGNETRLTGGESSSFKVVRRGTKRPRVSNVTATGRPKHESTITLEAINGVDDLIENLENIDLSPRMVPAIDDPLLQRYFELGSNNGAKTRTNEWLAAFLDDQLQKIEEKKAAGKALVDVLRNLQSYTRYTKTLPPQAESFFARYLTHWNGEDNRDVILNLLSYVSVRPWQDLQSSIFNPLESALLDNTAESTGALLEFYTALLRHWTARLLGPHPDPGTASAVRELTGHTSVLTLSLLTGYPTTAGTLAVAVSHYEAISDLLAHAPVPIATPPPLTIYLLTFLAPSLPTLSGLCSVLARQKVALEAMPPAARPNIITFNGFLMDICNLLWRSRAFNATDTNASGCLFPTTLLPALEAYTTTPPPSTSSPSSSTSSISSSSAPAPACPLSARFSLSHHPVLAALSIAAFRSLEDDHVDAIRIRHAGPVGQKSLAALADEGGVRTGWKEYRLRVLGWLADRGVEGIGALMGCTMKGLMGKAEPNGGTGV